jgi:hypothetical protein
VCVRGPASLLVDQPASQAGAIFGNFIPKGVPLGLAFLLPDDDSQNPETRRPPVAVLQQWGDGAAAPQAGARGAAAFSVGR